eukprot:augustus_masked-scaffold_49-processed-gene-1.22-mRNA-1 protein AED:1.00 eAED:1.00 QI:0/0/0/0/1/1/2/0/228
MGNTQPQGQKEAGEFVSNFDSRLDAAELKSYVKRGFHGSTNGPLELLTEEEQRRFQKFAYNASLDTSKNPSTISGDSKGNFSRLEILGSLDGKSVKQVVQGASAEEVDRVVQELREFREEYLKEVMRVAKAEAEIENLRQKVVELSRVQPATHTIDSISEKVEQYEEVISEEEVEIEMGVYDDIEGCRTGSDIEPEEIFKIRKPADEDDYSSEEDELEVVYVPTGAGK